MPTVLDIVNQTLIITGFVFVMMLVLEYVNVLTSGTWQRLLARSQWGQILLAAFLGVTPGCLGAFVVVAMYSHRMISVGAVVAAMIATSGDESFVMLATIPEIALLLHGMLFGIGFGAGLMTDLVMRRISMSTEVFCTQLALHVNEGCECYPRGRILGQWSPPSPLRALLCLMLSVYLLSTATGQSGPPEWNWVRVSLLLVTGLALFIVATVPDHFLLEHLWNHVARKHVPRIFLWTLGILGLMHVLVEQLDLGSHIQENLWAALGVASLTGLIPESGPHLLFVLLFTKGTIPFSILLANSLVQDGHGTLPLLAHSRKEFFLVKLINLAVGLLAGGIVLALGF
jgi:hypothetical protein